MPMTRIDYQIIRFYLHSVLEKTFRELRQKLAAAIESGDEKQLEDTMKEFKSANVPDPNNLYERAERDVAIIKAKRGTYSK